jgi:hypothetical protein
MSFYEISHFGVKMITVDIVEFLFECLYKAVIYENENMFFTDVALSDNPHEIIELSLNDAFNYFLRVGFKFTLDFFAFFLHFLLVSFTLFDNFFEICSFYYLCYLVDFYSIFFVASYKSVTDTFEKMMMD